MSTDPYPECSKLAEVDDDVRTIAEFVEWLHGQGVHFITWIDDRTWEGYHVAPERAAAEFFGVDWAKLQAEREAMVRSLR